MIRISGSAGPVINTIGISSKNNEKITVSAELYLSLIKFLKGNMIFLII